ncbi:hypothetical protein DUI87_28244 [Hirundo rustica rustica]|uniref:Cleavage and polyadenylation specificity factor subunit 4 n=1 Tax=Hirundo rustica rustica TaxID=333673 RepID=A0A3M0J2G5_HIRRU|nr:hypothetical protein DUI87_28244 [Hirundo rustica rustica]
MQELVTGVEKIRFDSEADVEELRARPLPFPGVDGVQGHPRRGGAKPAVCKHWLRGLCKRGDGCDFQHDYDASRMPECYFYSKFGPLCKYKHTRRVMCVNYLVGFCPEGPKCKFVHLKAGLMTSSTDPSKVKLFSLCPRG